MLRILSVTAVAAIMASTTFAFAAQTSADNRGTGDQFSSEADARSHCQGDKIVWANTKTHVYHFAGNKVYGHTKHGAFMCQADADHSGRFRAAKNENPTTGSPAR